MYGYSTRQQKIAIARLRPERLYPTLVRDCALRGVPMQNNYAEIAPCEARLVTCIIVIAPVRLVLAGLGVALQLRLAQLAVPRYYGMT